MQEPIQISLAAARVNAEMSQEEVAKALKISKTTIVNWEKGKSEPKADQAYQLCKLYQLPFDMIRFHYDRDKK